MWPCELLVRGLAALVRRRLPLLVSVQYTVLSRPTVTHSGRSIRVAPATRAAALVLISTSACELKSMSVCAGSEPRSEEHTSELQSLMRISYAVFCLKQKNKQKHTCHT